MISVFLMLVLLLQLLPVQQAVQYFFVDNILVEEIQHNTGFCKNFKSESDDHNLPGTDIICHHFTVAVNVLSFHFVEHLPSFYAKDIHTPPPNGIAI